LGRADANDAYEARFVRNRNYRMHQRAARLLARVIVPPERFRWLIARVLAKSILIFRLLPAQ